MKKTLLFLLVAFIAGNAQSQSKRLAAYYCQENTVSYSLNFFTNNLSYFVYTDVNGKQLSFKQAADGKNGEYRYIGTGDVSAELQVKDPGQEPPAKLKARFTLGGKTVKLVFRKDDRGIVD